MAIVNHNLLLKNAQGVLGEYYIMIRGGKEILVRRPNRSGHVPKASEKQGQELFRLAQQYAAGVNKDPARKEFYRPFKKGGQSEYNLALADYKVAPVIFRLEGSEYSGKAGDTLLAYAKDNIRVTRVLFRLENSRAQVLEEGEGTETGQLDEWSFMVQSDHPTETGDLLVCTAFDFAGNKTVESTLLR